MFRLGLSLLSLLSFLSFSRSYHSFLVRNSPSSFLIGAWYPIAFFSSAVGSLVRVISTIVKNLSFSTFLSPCYRGIKTSTIFFSLMLITWWRPGTLRLITSATQSARSIRRSAALMVTNFLSSPKKRVRALVMYFPELCFMYHRLGKISLECLCLVYPRSFPPVASPCNTWLLLTSNYLQYLNQKIICTIHKYS